MRGGRIVPQSKLPPAYPTARNVPIDQSLRRAAVKELNADMVSPDAEIRAHALEAIEKEGKDAAADAVSAGLIDADPLVRYAACLTAGQLQLQRDHDTLLQLAEDKDSGVRVVARYALHRLGDYRYSHDLELLSRDTEARVRGTTAMVLGMLHRFHSD